MSETREQKRKRQREWVAKRRAAYFADKTCADCGGLDNLQIHHLDRTTKVDHKVFSWSEARRKEELAKCIVVCHGCHWGRHREEGMNRPTKHIDEIHGTTYGYRRGCRCEDCKEAKRKYNRWYESNKRT